jgi:hypothetical protein
LLGRSTLRIKLKPSAPPTASATRHDSSPTVINNFGEILGSSAASEPGTWNVSPARPVVWIGGQVFDLQASLDAATGEGWTIASASAINNLGQIAGSGTHNGLARAFLLAPITQ